MVIETYTQGPEAVYERVRARSRAGLAYLESWVEKPGLDRCFQLMETEKPSLFDQWIAG